MKFLWAAKVAVGASAHFGTLFTVYSSNEHSSVFMACFGPFRDVLLNFLVICSLHNLFTLSMISTFMREFETTFVLIKFRMPVRFNLSSI